jgi:hypothetical protein
MLVGDSNDENVVRLNGIKQFVRKSVKKTSSHIATFSGPGDRMFANAFGG